MNKKAVAVYDNETVEIYVHKERIAIHKRVFAEGYTTVAEHMPPNHRAYRRSREYNADYFLHKRRMIGTATTEVLRRILLFSALFVQQSYQACQGILRPASRYTPQGVEAACKRASSCSIVN